LAGSGADTLLQQTQQRLEGLPGLAPSIVICNEDHRFIVAEQMRQLGVLPAAILLEPVGRNTAPAVAVAALQATAAGQDPLLLVLAADHVIRDSSHFRAAVEVGIPAAQAGQLVTFGIVPTAAETGYGYIEAAQPLNAGPTAPVPIHRFVEKPDRATAEQFLSTGRFTWNSGMFLFKASAILAELERLAPEVVSACRSALEHDSSDLDFLRLEREACGLSEHRPRRGRDGKDRPGRRAAPRCRMERCGQLECPMGDLRPGCRWQCFEGQGD
jgi:mannose-1-phosphate guanylyltransferase